MIDREAVRIAMALQLVAGAACGPPTLLDTDLRPVHEPAFLLPVPYGWVAVDTAADRTRVIVELHVDTDRAAGREHWPAPTLECPAKHLHRADRVRRDGPYCFPAPEREGCPDGAACGLELRRPERCTYLVRAEFRLHVPPAAGDTLTLVTGRWRAPRVLRRP